MNKYILYAIGGLAVLLLLIFGIKYWVFGKTDTGPTVVQPGDFSIR